MPKRFYVYFLLLVAANFAALYLNTLRTDTLTQQLNEGLASQSYIAFMQRETAIAQEFANNLAAIADMETRRAYQLDRSIIRIQQMYMQLYQEAEAAAMLSKGKMQLLNGYINQLSAELEANEIPVPAPDPAKFGDLGDDVLDIRLIMPGQDSEIPPAPPASDN